MSCLVALVSLAGIGPATGEADDGDRGADEWRGITSAFARPPAEFRLVHYGTHDGAPLPVARMAEAGIGGVMLFMQSNGYLRSEEAWRNLEANVRAARAAGLRVWLADDNGYPSGMAGGLVVEADPAFESRGLVVVTQDGTGPVAARLDLPPWAEAFVHARLYPVVDGRPALDRGQPASVHSDRVEAEGLEGPWRLFGFARAINREGTQASTTVAGFATTGRYPNLLDSAATEKFVALTHEQYASRLGPLAGTIDVVYTNEPNLMTCWFLPGARPGDVALVPWHEDLVRRFQAEHGYDLLPLLPALFGGDDPASRLTRRHYYQTVGTALAENFPRRITSWGAGQGVRSAGHPLLEESMLHHVVCYGDFFRFVQELNMPACDLPMPDRSTSFNFWMPKFLSSVAQARGRTVVVGLLDPIINRPVAQLQPTPEDVRRFVGLAALCGVNQFTTYTAWQRYDPGVYRSLNDSIGRLGVVLRGATSAATVGVYYPIETFQAALLPSADLLSGQAWMRVQGPAERQDTVARSLVTQGIDFTWLHGDWISEGRVEAGHLVTAGGRYATLVMPDVEILPLAVAKKLAEFQAGGGRIIWVQCLPALGDSLSEHEAVRALFAGQPITAATDVVRELGPVLPPGFAVAVAGPAQGIFTARFVRAGRRITFIVNDGFEPADVEARSAAGGTFTADVFDPLTGTMAPTQVPGKLSIGPCSSLLIVER